MKTVTIDFRDHRTIDHWWTDFVLQCHSSNDFEKQLERYGITLYQPDVDVIEVTFPDENSYLMFRLRWP